MDNFNSNVNSSDVIQTTFPGLSEIQKMIQSEDISTLVDPTSRQGLILIVLIFIICAIGLIFILTLIKKLIVKVVILAVVMFLLSYFSLVSSTTVLFNNPAWGSNLINAIPGTIGGVGGFLLSRAIWNAMGVIPDNLLKISSPTRLIMTGLMVAMSGALLHGLFGYKAAMIDASNFELILGIMRKAGGYQQTGE